MNSHLVNFEEPKGNQVDHSLMHHLNTIVLDSGTYAMNEFDDDLGKIEEGTKSMTERRRVEKKTKSSVNVYTTKRVAPTPEVKHNIRDKMFNFLDSSHIEEEELVIDSNHLSLNYSTIFIFLRKGKSRHCKLKERKRKKKRYYYQTNYLICKNGITKD